MPYMEINTSLELNDEEKHQLCEDIGEFISIVPGKSREITMMNLKAGCYIEFPGLSNPCPPTVPSINIEFRILGRSPFRSKKDFVREVTSMLCEKYSFEPWRVFVNIFECDSWGFRGEYRDIMIIEETHKATGDLD